MNNKSINLLNKAIKKLNFKKNPQSFYSPTYPLPSYFPSAEYNITYNCLDRHLANLSLKPAIYYNSPLASLSGFLTYKQLHKSVNSFAKVLLKLNISKSDKVLIFLPNILECAYFQLACMRIGAQFHTCIPGMGVKELEKRLTKLKPKVCISTSFAYEPQGIIELFDVLKYAQNNINYEGKNIVLKREGLKNKLSNNCIEIVSEEIEKEYDEKEDNIEINYEAKGISIYMDENNKEMMQRGSAGYSFGTFMSMQRELGTIIGDKIFCANSISSSFGMTYGLIGPLLMGCSTILVEGEMEENKFYLDLLLKNEVNIFLGKDNLIKKVFNKQNDQDYKFDSLKTIAYSISNNNLNFDLKLKNNKHIHVCKMLYRNEVGIPLAANSFIDPGFKLNKLLDFKCDKEGNLYLKYPYAPSFFEDVISKKNKIPFLNSYLKDGYFNLETNCKIIENDEVVINKINQSDSFDRLGFKISNKSLEKEIIECKIIKDCAVLIDHETEDKDYLILFCVLKNDLNNSISENIKIIRNYIKLNIGKNIELDKIIIVSGIPKAENNEHDIELLRNIAFTQSSNNSENSSLAKEIANKVNSKLNK